MFCLLHTENDRNPSQTVINKHNNRFEECVPNPPAYVNNSYHPFYAFMRSTLVLNVINVLNWGQLIQSADHWFILSSFTLCCYFIINNKLSVCVGVSQITRTVYMLHLIRSKWTGWEKNINKWIVGVVYNYLSVM